MRILKAQIIVASGLDMILTLIRIALRKRVKVSLNKVHERFKLAFEADPGLS